jgi:uncharacterized protein YdeI (BOF family)
MRNPTVIVLAIIALSASGTIMLAGCAGSGAHEQSIARAADPAPPSKPAVSENAARVLQGKLVKIEGESYVVHDAGGKEVRVHVGKDTALDSRIKVGDKIDVQVSVNGHATTVLKALE